VRRARFTALDLRAWCAQSAHGWPLSRTNSRFADALAFRSCPCTVAPAAMIASSDAVALRSTGVRRDIHFRERAE
jgi:hypothetical protein